ncbi:hypothetical protein HRbin37_01712 [bacterium HR37]|nr:hypothetical protein HRbin37_01712 [bacterium HR37]
MVKPNIVLSKCINLESVRYNGGIIRDEFVERLGKFVNYIPVCPEMAIGMGVPRPPVTLIKTKNQLVRIVEPKTGKDHTDRMNKFSEEYLNSISEVDGFLLKAKSPSCGVHNTKIFSPDTGIPIGKGSGLFAQRVIDLFPGLPVEDEMRLKNYWIRRNFLTKIFAFADLRFMLKETRNIKELILFHQRYKYLLMLYNQKGSKTLGQLIANWKSKGFEKTLKEYGILFRNLFHRKPPIKAHINVLQHIYGHFSDKINRGEKLHFQKLLEKLQNGSLELDAVIEYVKGFVYRFDDEYLKSQAYLSPYPEELE